MHVPPLALVTALLLATSSAHAQKRVRAFTTVPVDSGLLAVMKHEHGMGGDFTSYLWDDGRIQSRYDRDRVSEERKVPISALAELHAAIRHLQPSKHRGVCLHGILDGPDTEVQFRRGADMVHLPCIGDGDSNPAFWALNDLLSAAREYPWWLARPKLEVLATRPRLLKSSGPGPSVRFRAPRKRGCRKEQPALVLFTEREDGSVVVYFDGCLEDGPAPEAIEMIREGDNVILRSSKVGASVVQDRCLWSSELDLGKLVSPTQVTIDLGRPWTFRIAREEVVPGAPH